MNRTPRLRFAPSPTGYLHIGGARTALFNWLYARRHGGTFVLRMEDTDRKRSTPESVEAILEGLRWLGIDWDEGPFFQTQRLATYREQVERMIAEGHAYRCYCSKDELRVRRELHDKEKRVYRYERTCRERKDEPDLPYVVRLKVPDAPGERVGFKDLVLGEISKELSDLEDSVLLRGDGIPLYNLGCVVDDHLMDITLVGRGQEHVNSTLPQLLIYRALGWEPPQFAHFPLILGPDREKLSKRKHPEADVMVHRRNGILPEALVNFVARLGWSHGDDEVISREQMIEWFGFDHVGSTSGVWNPEKLLWVNQQWMKNLPSAEVAARLVPFLAERGIAVTPGDPRVEGVVKVMRARTRTLKEMAETAGYFFSSGVELDAKAAAKHLGPESRKLLEEVRAQLGAAGAWEAGPLDEVMKRVAEGMGIGLGKVAQPVRVAVTGGTASPGIGETLELVGREETLRRLETAMARAGADAGAGAA